MKIITKTTELSAFCQQLAKHDFICVDTEFIRERTFYSQLCLIQASGPDVEAIIDPLSKELDLAPFLELLMDENIIKVMHSARQDLEIFYNLCQALPAPLFDTQIAAMALGFGDSVGYMALVKGCLGITLDKGARFTDWSKRPLSDKQLTYALGDVTHLRDLYPDMRRQLIDKKRLHWIEEEMAQLLNEELYTFSPETAWQRLKIRNSKIDYLAALKYVASWREAEAQSRNIPRRRILKDDGVYDIAQNRPATPQALASLRGVPNGFERSKGADKLLRGLKQALANKHSYAPKIPKPKRMPSNLGPTIDMLRTLLRLRSEYNDIAPRLIANSADIEALAAFGDQADIAALSGWRREVFGNDALEMLSGKVALKLEGRKVIAQSL